MILNSEHISNDDPAPQVFHGVIETLHGGYNSEEELFSARALIDALTMFTRISDSWESPEHGDLPNALTVPEKVPDALPFSPVVKRYFVEGLVNGTQVEALPDNGASLCFISSSLVTQLNLHPDPETQRNVHLANKKIVHSPGIVKVPWKFTGEKKNHLLRCWVLPETPHDLILGSSFLRATQTLTKYVQRIKSEVVALPKRLRLQLLGNETQRLWGYLNYNYTAAFPDTGSDAMLISREYAGKLGLGIDADDNNRIEIELGDGTIVWTSGIVREVDWEVGGMTVRCDFHVLDNLCVDVVLSNNYLFEFYIFSECTKNLHDYGTEEPQLCNIRLTRQYGKSLDSLEEDVTAPDSFEPEKVQRELARRDYIRDAIAELPTNQQDAARLSEIQRQNRWESLRKARRASRPQLPTSRQQQGPSPSPSIPTTTRLTGDRNKVQVKTGLRTWLTRR